MFSEDGAATSWRQAAASRSIYLAVPTARMFAGAALQPGARVLIVGGGTGDEAIEAARAVGPAGEVTLTDLSPGMIEEGRRAVTEAGFPQIRCLAMDVQALDFAAATFDAVVGRNFMMFVPDLARGLAEIRRVLKPGGRFAATTWASGARNPRLSIPLEAARSVGVELPPDTGLRLALGLNRPDRLAARVRRAGFKDVKVETAPATARPEDWDAFLQDLKSHVGTRSVAREVPAALQERFWQSLDRRFLRHRREGELRGEQLVVSATG